jgi:hypothetical protein
MDDVSSADDAQEPNSLPQRPSLDPHDPRPPRTSSHRPTISDQMAKAVAPGYPREQPLNPFSKDLVEAPAPLPSTTSIVLVISVRAAASHASAGSFGGLIDPAGEPVQRALSARAPKANVLLPHASDPPDNPISGSLSRFRESKTHNPQPVDHRLSLAGAARAQ